MALETSLDIVNREVQGLGNGGKSVVAMARTRGRPLSSGSICHQVHEFRDYLAGLQAN